MNYFKIYSVSTMVDMPQFYPEALIDAFESRLAKGEKCHTLVVWTKFPGAILAEPLKSFLLSLREQNIQVALQLTVTGMGGTAMEPNVPKYQDSIALLHQVIEIFGSPDRIKLRIDPQLRYKDAAGVVHSNYDLFEPILAGAAKCGIKLFTTSFVENDTHAKVVRRFNALGLSLMAPDDAERTELCRHYQELATKYGVSIASCSVPGLPMSACIDADWLESTHPLGLKLDHTLKKARPLCGCVKNIDLGGWPPKACPSGCQYCYARSTYK